MDKVFLEYIESQPDYSEVASLLVSPENLIEPYKHLTFEITSLTDYLKLINLIVFARVSCPKPAPVDCP